MWQRFTERARRVIFFAQEEAERWHENIIQPEHLLLALLRESDTVAGRLMGTVDAPLPRIREIVESEFKDRADNTKTDMKLSPRGKRTIELAYDQARQLNNNYIGTEHLLLGVIREDGRASRILAMFGATLDRIRAETIGLQDAARQADTPPAAEVGDLGVLKASEGRTRVEVAVDAVAFVQLFNIFRAKDAYGYRAMAHGDQSMFLVAEGTRVKRLAPQVAFSDRVAEAQGHYVRILTGPYEGYEGWVFTEAFQRTGADEVTFPPSVS